MTRVTGATQFRARRCTQLLGGPCQEGTWTFRHWCGAPWHQHVPIPPVPADCCWTTWAEVVLKREANFCAIPSILESWGVLRIQFLHAFVCQSMPTPGISSTGCTGLRAHVMPEPPPPPQRFLHRFWIAAESSMAESCMAGSCMTESCMIAAQSFNIPSTCEVLVFTLYAFLSCTQLQGWTLAQVYLWRDAVRFLESI